MLSGFLGKKIGMTQIFDAEGNVIPVTVVDVNNWIVTQIKTSDNDGYGALQIGLPRARYRNKPFQASWLEKKKNYFLHLREVKLNNANHTFVLGQQVNVDDAVLQEGEKIAVTGRTKGLGFQGVVKRWNFGGGPKAHGSKFHRKPGSSGHLRRQGEIIKGKKFPGHYGDEQVTVRGLKLVRIDKENGCLFIKGAVPGKKDSLIVIKKQGK